jgi:uncharacterized protein YndB with AHSA1/START domain
MESPDRHGSLRAIVEIAAPPDAVFTALSDERELAAWLGGDGAPPVARCPAWAAPSLAIPGQPWSVPALAPDGSRGSVQGEFVLVDPPHRLECTWRASWDGFAPDRVCFELVPIRIGGDAGTRVTVTHTRAGARLQVTAMASVGRRGDWPTMLARLGARVSRRVPFGVDR